MWSCGLVFITPENSNEEGKQQRIIIARAANCAKYISASLGSGQARVVLINLACRATYVPSILRQEEVTALMATGEPADLCRSFEPLAEAFRRIPLCFYERRPEPIELLDEEEEPEPNPIDFSRLSPCPFEVWPLETKRDYKLRDPKHILARLRSTPYDDKEAMREAFELALVKHSNAEKPTQRREIIIMVAGNFARTAQLGPDVFETFAMRAIFNPSGLREEETLALRSAFGPLRDALEGNPHSVLRRFEPSTLGEDTLSAMTLSLQESRLVVLCDAQLMRKSLEPKCTHSPHEESRMFLRWFFARPNPNQPREGRKRFMSWLYDEDDAYDVTPQFARDYMKSWGAFKREMKRQALKRKARRVYDYEKPRHDEEEPLTDRQKTGGLMVGEEEPKHDEGQTPQCAEKIVDSLSSKAEARPKFDEEEIRQFAKKYMDSLRLEAEAKPKKPRAKRTKGLPHTDEFKTCVAARRILRFLEWCKDEGRFPAVYARAIEKSAVSFQAIADFR